MSCILRRTARFSSHPATNEHGSVLPYLSIAAALIALVALTLMTSLGDAILHRRDASNAADAAALAAARVWADSIESTYGKALGAADPLSLWSSAGKGLGAFAGPRAKLEAERYASLGDATLTAYSVDVARGTVTVSVRTNSTITGTNRRMTATSTAKVVAEKGACFSSGKIGLKIDGKCISKPDDARTPSQRKQLDSILQNKQEVRLGTQLVS